jgi:uncharacterized membrane protein YraQ (UPF0718 family)
MNTLVAIFTAALDIFMESAPFMLFGFFMAGLLKAFVPATLVHKHLGTSRISNVFKAALFGIPLPLCSCGVIPAAAGLRRQGASKGATASFLISTPETGVDSVMVTYALLDPIMTILRPLAAFVTAVATGIGINLFDKATAPTPTPPLKPFGEIRPPAWKRFFNGQRFAFNDVLGDVGGSFMIGILIAGVITVFLSPDLVTTYLGQGLLPMLVMVLVAAPLYVCATASTPIVAALALKGISPGAALVFLLAGPATNAASLAMVAKLLGKKSAALYLASIIGVAILFGLGADALYRSLGLDPLSWLAQSTEHGHGILNIIAGTVLFILLVRTLITKMRSGHVCQGACCSHQQ